MGQITFRQGTNVRLTTTRAYDGNGNVTALIDGATGALLTQYEYGPFGEPIRATGALAKTNPVRFSTKYHDDETDLLYYGYRYYGPSAGRWLSRDPIGENGGGNLYGFVGNDAVDGCDPFGFKDYSVQFNIHEAPWRKSSWVALRGEIIVSVEGALPGQVVQIAFKVTGPATSANKQHWSTYKGLGRQEIRTDGWLWPNLAAVLNARGSMRYGGPDPGKIDPYWPEGIDNDFGGVTVQRESASGPPLVSADWVNENGATALEAISHSARIAEEFSLWMGWCSGPDPVGVWFAYCDVGQGFGEMLNAGWPLEFMGTDFAFVRITWTTSTDGSLEPHFNSPSSAPPASPMWDHWGQWKLDGAVPRYMDFGNP